MSVKPSEHAEGIPGYFVFGVTRVLQACCKALTMHDVFFLTNSTQGRVRVVLNPSRYEIPSGSAYGYIIADNAEQARRRDRHERNDWLS
jgi:hypothetical protein